MTREEMTVGSFIEARSLIVAGAIVALLAGCTAPGTAGGSQTPADSGAGSDASADSGGPADGAADAGDGSQPEPRTEPADTVLDPLYQTGPGYAVSLGDYQLITAQSMEAVGVDCPNVNPFHVDEFAGTEYAYYVRDGQQDLLGQLPECDPTNHVGSWALLEREPGIPGLVEVSFQAIDEDSFLVDADEVEPVECLSSDTAALCQVRDQTWATFASAPLEGDQQEQYDQLTAMAQELLTVVTESEQGYLPSSGVDMYYPHGPGVPITLGDLALVTAEDLGLSFHLREAGGTCDRTDYLNSSTVYYLPEGSGVAGLEMSDGDCNLFNEFLAGDIPELVRLESPHYQIPYGQPQPESSSCDLQEQVVSCFYNRDVYQVGLSRQLGASDGRDDWEARLLEMAHQYVDVLAEQVEGGTVRIAQEELPSGL
ncbi:hypothetical protein IM660_03205 [Ruania alkalisoli]|uniref:Uncharacterized protein n=1 Tax=Ruania alkalisoli TaxID=2779775 RepID=A0A7M1SWJ8_9MICO|nr:hypothetical protein [Ruania alkalisoli]QOR71324.1 hypothetical protein IM660_03205 [Ruania alkalisoli]